MKNMNIYEFLHAEAALNNIKDNKIKCAIYRNRKKCEAEKDLLAELIKPSPEFEEYDKQRNELNMLFSKGKKKMVGNVEVHDIPEDDIAIHQERMRTLMDKHKDIITEHNIKTKNFNKMLEEEISPELVITKVKIDDCNELTYEQMKIIDFMLED